MDDQGGFSSSFRPLLVVIKIVQDNVRKLWNNLKFIFFKDICEKKFGNIIVRLLRKQIGKNHEMIKFKFSRCVVKLGTCV